jgi:hypothetical protein
MLGGVFEGGLLAWYSCIVRRLNMRTHHTIFFDHCDLLYEV